MGTRVLKISTALFLAALRDGNNVDPFTVTRGLPEDTKVLAVGCDGQMFSVFLSSPSWEDEAGVDDIVVEITTAAAYWPVELTEFWPDEKEPT